MKKRYPCRRLLDTGGERDAEYGRDECGQPSYYVAMGNEARYGHVCAECWEGLGDGEKDLYAPFEATR